MSHSPVIVRFPDGTIRYGCYTGTSDHIVGPLVDDPEQWFDLRHKPVIESGDPEPVEIWCGYGGNSWWEGTATRDGVQLGRCPYGYEELYKPGQVPERQRRCEQHDGDPPWVIELLAEGHPLHAFLSDATLTGQKLAPHWLTLAGPAGSGKTDAAIQMVRGLPAESEVLLLSGEPYTAEQWARRIIDILSHESAEGSVAARDIRVRPLNVTFPNGTRLHQRILTGPPGLAVKGTHPDLVIFEDGYARQFGPDHPVMWELAECLRPGGRVLSIETHA